MRTYGINASVLNLPRWTGVERYVFELLKEMKQVPLAHDERVLLYCVKPVESLNPLPQGWEWRTLNWWLPKGWTHGRLSAELLFSPPDVFFGPGHEVPLFGRQQKTVFTVHDVAFKQMPELYLARDRARQESAVRQGIKKAHALLTVSQATSDDLHQLYDVPIDQMTITHLALPSRVEGLAIQEDVLHRHHLEKRKYLLYVGRVEQKKNIATLIQAFSKLQHEHMFLVIAGSDGFGADEIKRLANDRVRFLGYVSDADLPSLYAGAFGFLFPSRYEGFGMPVLEAFHAQVPVIASDIASLREVAGEAALFVDVMDVDGWVEAMHRLISEYGLRDQLVHMGMRRIQDFSWVTTARKTWGVLRSV